ncbi:hypothetical protein Dsin_026665 [Dipteronia sinensis]|uniref:Small auxin up regulated protein n=1 Tax=Dipteronia sinensis TaxID=43782 RepID=A0AAD9ZYC8_9ROSI|nr:hypothetical protein Dsin_026665 [Dipteronia sinensis]
MSLLECLSTPLILYFKDFPYSLKSINTYPVFVDRCFVFVYPPQPNQVFHILTSHFCFSFSYQVITMAIRVPGIMQAKQNLRQSKLFANQAAAASSSVNVSKGHVAVYVGERQKKRFVVPISFLNQPSFQELLRKAEEEFGFHHPTGGLTIPCREDIFINLTSSLNGS